LSAQTIIEAMYTCPPLVFGHRGAKAYAPMNTLPAFELAAAQGAQGIELDVHFSQDRRLVVLHDYTVDATTDGSGYAAALPLSELKMLDAGSWFAPEFAGTRIPTLDEVFEAVGERLLINVEIKSESVEPTGLEEAVADCIRRHDLQKRVLVSSFNVLALRRFRTIVPDVPLGYLYAQISVAGLEEAVFEAYHPHFERINPELVEQARRHRKFVNAWTVNDPARAIELCRMGVHGIITDNPDTVLAALAEA
jgi:glycerophosphoryl diester phosphodiesterase